MRAPPPSTTWVEVILDKTNISCVAVIKDMDTRVPHVISVFSSVSFWTFINERYLGGNANGFYYSIMHAAHYKYKPYKNFHVSKTEGAITWHLL